MESDETGTQTCTEAFCKTCVTREFPKFLKYHSDYYIKEMTHGQHSLIEIGEYSDLNDRGDVILKGYKTTVSKEYWNPNSIDSDLQTCTIVDYCDVCCKAIERIEWICLGC